MSLILNENLKRMFNVENIEQVPEDFCKRCDRVEELIRRTKLSGSFWNIQVLAMMVEQWEESTFTSKEKIDDR